jgi:hypothetical protein
MGGVEVCNLGVLTTEISALYLTLHDWKDNFGGRSQQWKKKSPKTTTLDTYSLEMPKEQTITRRLTKETKQLTRKNPVQQTALSVRLDPHVSPYSLPILPLLET